MNNDIKFQTIKLCKQIDDHRFSLREKNRLKTLNLSMRIFGKSLIHDTVSRKVIDSPERGGKDGLTCIDKVSLREIDFQIIKLNRYMTIWINFFIEKAL